MSEFQDKSVVVTGGNSGIGLAIAKAFQLEGAKLAITGRAQDKLDTAVSELGASTFARQVDMASVAEIDGFMQQVKDRHGRIDVLIANAGGATIRPFMDVDEELFDFEMNRNYRGTYFSVQKALPHMPDGSSIVMIGSGSADRGFEGMSTYGPTKAAVRTLARYLAKELAPRGIRTNVVSPGPVFTPGMERMGLPPEGVDQVKNGLMAMVPLGRLGEAEEIAQAVTFVASARAAFATGAEFPIDGGAIQV